MKKNKNKTKLFTMLEMQDQLTRLSFIATFSYATALALKKQGLITDEMLKEQLEDLMSEVKNDKKTEETNVGEAAEDTCVEGAEDRDPGRASGSNV